MDTSRDSKQQQDGTLRAGVTWEGGLTPQGLDASPSTPPRGSLLSATHQAPAHGPSVSKHGPAGVR